MKKILVIGTHNKTEPMKPITKMLFVIIIVCIPLSISANPDDFKLIKDRVVAELMKSPIDDAQVKSIMNKMNEDPECEILEKKYYNIGKKMGMDFDNPVEFTDFLYTSKDPKIIALRDSYQKEWNNIERKHSPKPNTYKWYQCFGACFFLAAWQEALAKKVFPNFKWQTIQNHKSLPANSRYGGHSTSIGIGPKGKIIIFDILLFENTNLDGILNAAGVDLPSLCENY